MDQYYLQDSRFFMGNTVAWWAKDGGYTVDVSQAKVMSKDEAYAWQELHEYNVPWPKEYIDAHTKPTVDLMDIERRDADRSVKGLTVELPNEQL